MAKPLKTRFEFKQDATFRGRLINRQQPIYFKLDGRNFDCFEGDTILSALLASGVDCVGQLHGQPLALDESLCPPVVLIGGEGIAGPALPMDRIPALDGMVLKTFMSPLSAKKVKRTGVERIKRALSGLGKSSLDMDLSSGEILPGPWVDQPAQQELSADLLVVGGGVAGLSAALEGVRSGWKTILVEQRRETGGDAPFFGALEGEQRPKTLIKALYDELLEHQNAQIFTNAQALSVSGASVRVHRIRRLEGGIKGEMLRISAKKLILATGTLERLPVFPGNRLPGVVKARSSFHMAVDYAVWRGESAAFCTSSSAATQVALLAADMGVKIPKLADSRARPRSRFFEFAKAYGISLATGTQVASAVPGEKGRLSVQFGLTTNASMQSVDALDVDSLIVCGGWQPDLMLWHAAGGQSTWNHRMNQLQAEGTLADIYLAGSCMGALSMSACANSGRSAFFKVSGLPVSGEMLDDPDLEYESDDGELPVVQGPQGAQSCFLDSGYSFAQPAPAMRAGLLERIFGFGQKKKITPASDLRVYTLGEVAAKVGLSEIPVEFAGIIAQERCIHAGRFGDALASEPPGKNAPDPVPEGVPIYLKGRFGKHARVVQISAPGKNDFEVGSQLFLDTETTSPFKAIGSIIRIATDQNEHSLAYADVSMLSKDQKLVVRSDTHVVMASVLTTSDQ